LLAAPAISEPPAQPNQPLLGADRISNRSVLADSGCRSEASIFRHAACRDWRSHQRVHRHAEVDADRQAVKLALNHIAVTIRFLFAMTLILDENSAKNE
jgi:hypothetical protein